MFEAVDLTKRYEDGVLALDHLSFSVSPGQIYAMLGGNGAGKTTTINLFLNFIEPTEGEARIDGIVDAPGAAQGKGEDRLRLRERDALPEFHRGAESRITSRG